MSPRLLLCGIALLGVSTGSAQSAARADTLHVLLVGNSYLYYNNAPAMLEAIARASRGPVIQTRLVAHGGWSLQDHLEDSTTRRIMAERRWDWVVVNEQSMLGMTYFLNGVQRVYSARRFAASAAQLASQLGERGAKLLIVRNWSRRTATSRDAQALAFAFDSVSRALQVPLAPVDVAWTLSSMRSVLYDPDGSHPSPAGSYLLANVLYASITRRAPSGSVAKIQGSMIEQADGTVRPESVVTLVSLTRGTAQKLQTAAWVAVQRYWSQPAQGVPAKMPPLALPSLPQRRDPLTAARLAGEWRGFTTLYPGKVPTGLALKIDTLENKLRGTLTLRPGTADSSSVAAEIVIERDSVIQFVDPKGPNSGTVLYRGVLSRARLEGVAEFRIPDPWLSGAGTWQLTKQVRKQ